MRNLRGTYVHRGDAVRRRKRLKQALFAAGSIAVTVIVIAARRTTTANAEPALTKGQSSFFSIGDSRKLRHELESAQGELSLLRAQYDRADKIIQYSTKFGINAGMAANVFDASLREGIDPD